MMRNPFNEIMQKLRAQRVRARRYTAMLLVLAMLTSLSVSWRLHQVGTALTTDNEYSCGMEEHVHTDDCYTEELVCGYEEGEPEDPDSAFSVDSEPTTEEPEAEPEEPEPEETEPEVHHHTADCYETVLVEHEELTCGQEEHTHDETCPVDPDTGDFLCGFEEHTHTDDCYTIETETEEKLVCGYEEGQVLSDGTAADDDGIAALEDTNTATSVADDSSSEAVSEPVLHHHTEACYEKVLTCTIPEHTHTLACLADYRADVETDDDWEKYSVGLSDNWNEALLAVAQEQLGYKESEKNFQTDEALGDIIDVHHYTRYGAFYGNPYADWDVAFIAFCQHYAGIPKTEIPQRLGLEALRADMDAMGFAYLTEGEDAAYEAIPGDVVTYNKNGTADDETIGIVETVGDDSLTVISGAVEGAVAEVTVPFTDVTSTILVDQAYGDYVGEADDRDGSDDDEIAVQPADEKDATAVDASDDAEVVHLDWQYVTEQVGTGGVTYNPTDDTYTVDMKLELAGIPHNSIDPSKIYELSFPKGVTVPDKQLSTDFERELKEPGPYGKKMGYYRFYKKDDGTYAIQYKFDKAYHDKTQGDYAGNISFSGIMKASGYDDDGKVIIGGQTGFEFKIDKEDIKYPDGDNGQYDLSTKKDAAFNKADSKLSYTVTVTSKKGTPGEVVFNDEIDPATLAGLELAKPTITVQKQTVTERRNSTDSNSWWKTSSIGWSDAPHNFTVDAESGKVTGTLDQMKTTYSDDQLERTYTEYQVTYTYDVSNIQNQNYEIKNKVTVSSDENEKNGVKGTDEKTAEIKNSYTVSKAASSYADGKITWKIKVNENGADITGAVLSDILKAGSNASQSGFDAAVNEITIEPKDKGYQWVTDENEQKTLKFTKIDGEPNTQNYEIVYSTEHKPEGTKYTVENTATLTPLGGKGSVSGSGSKEIGAISARKEASANDVKYENGKLVIPWKSTVDYSNLSEAAKGTVFNDTIVVDGGRSVHVMTPAQAQALKLVWVNSYGNEIGSAIDLSNYTAEFFTETNYGETSYSADNLPESGAKSFKVTLNEALVRPDGATKLALKYSTTAEEVKENNEYRNTFNVNGWKNVSSVWSYRYKAPYYKKTDGNDSTELTKFEDADGILTWKIHVYTGTAGLFTAATVTDVLPEGVEPISVEVKDRAGTIEVTPDVGFEKAWNNDVLKGKYTSETRTLTMTFSNEHQLKNDSTYVFIIKCRAVKDQYGNDVEAGKTYPYTNKAYVKLDGVDVTGSREQTQEWTKYKPADPVTKVLDKSGDWEAVNRKMSYSVKINPDGKKFFSDTFKSLKLKDVLTVSKHPSYIENKKGSQVLDASKVDVEAVLDTESVKLYYAKKDVEGKLVKEGEVVGWTLQTDVKENQNNQNEYKITLDKVPNGQPLILEYVYRIANNAKEVYPNATDCEVGVVKIGSLSNVITLEQTGESGGKDTEALSWDESTSSAYMGSGRVLTVVKTEAGNNKKTLEGAVFTLQKYNNGAYEDVTPAKTYTTGGGGVIQIKQGDANKGEYVFAENTLYRLIETTAPDGYLPVDDMTEAQQEDTAVYFFFGKGNGAEGILNIQPSAIDLNETSAAVRVENVPNTTSIAVRKAWKNADGTDADAGAGRITVQLHQVAYRNEPNETGYGVATFNCTESLYNQPIEGAGSLSEQLGVQPAGTTFQLKIETVNGGYTTDSQDRVTLSWNGEQKEPDSIQQPSTTNQWPGCTTTYIYNLKVRDGINQLNAVVANPEKSNNLKATVSLSDIIAPAVETPIAGSDTVINTVDLSESNYWQHVFENLPLKGTYNGETVHYAYYALETKMDSTDVSEDGGTYGDWTVTQGKTPITSGTITIVNTKKPDTPDTPGYELPATGSTGTAPYTTAGAVLMGAALVGGYRRKRRQERRGE